MLCIVELEKNGVKKYVVRSGFIFHEYWTLYGGDLFSLTIDDAFDRGEPEPSCCIDTVNEYRRKYSKIKEKVICVG